MKIDSARSEVSVCSPFKPTRQMEDSANAAVWANSDNPLYAAPPRNVIDAARLPVADKLRAPPLPRIAEAPPTRSNWLAKAVTTAGVLCGVFGTVAGLLSIVALGPIGLGVAAGAAILGTIIARQGVRMHRYD